MTLHQLLNEGTNCLIRAGAPDAQLDARRLLLEAFRLDTVHFLMNRMQLLEENRAVETATADYRRMIKQRCRRIPLQYILGNQEFMGMTFRVNRHVLIPRQDTETLVELVLEEEREKNSRILDLCTGSGCIAVSLAALGGYSDVTATDLSAEALKVAKDNANRLLVDYKGRIRFLQGDLFEALKEDALEDGGSEGSASQDATLENNTLQFGTEADRKTKQFDIITANPPYIPTEIIKGLQPEVRDYEPEMALDGDRDGLSFYRRIVGEAVRWLKPGGRIYLEIGHDQGEAVSCLLERAGFGRIRVIKDTPGLDRVVCGEYLTNV